MEPTHVSARDPRQLYLDEKVYWLREFIVDLPGKGAHRIQRIFVVRNDQLMPFDKNLGPEWLHAGCPLAQMYAGFEYSVGEVMEIAENMRACKPEPEEPRPLGELWLRQREEERELKAHRSVIPLGSGPAIQRS